MKGDQVTLRLDKVSFLFISLVLVVITIPLKNNWNSLAILCFVFAGLIQAPLRSHFKQLQVRRYWIIGTLFFFWLAATWFWDSPDAAFFKSIEKNLIFLSLPIIMTIIPRFPWPRLVIACYCFVATIFVLCIVSLVKAYLEYRVSANPFVFSYHYLSYQVALNAIFLSNYCFASIVWLLYISFLSRAPLPFKVPRAMVIFLCIFFFGMILMLSSKLIISLTTLTLFCLIIVIAGKKFLLPGLGIALLALLAAFLMIRNIDYLRFRFDTLEFKEYTGAHDDQNGLAARLLMWNSAVRLIKERPVLGYGPVNSKNELVRKYDAKGFGLGVEMRYNSHNQFLETWLNAGIIGLALLLLLVFYPLRAGWKESNVLLTIMILHYLLQSMVESTHTVQQELVFFWFFTWLFYYHLSSFRSLPGATASAGQPQPV